MLDILLCAHGAARRVVKPQNAVGLPDSRHKDKIIALQATWKEAGASQAGYTHIVGAVFTPSHEHKESLF